MGRGGGGRRRRGGLECEGRREGGSGMSRILTPVRR